MKTDSVMLFASQPGDTSQLEREGGEDTHNKRPDVTRRVGARADRLEGRKV